MNEVNSVLVNEWHCVPLWLSFQASIYRQWICLLHEIVAGNCSLISCNAYMCPLSHLEGLDDSNEVTSSLFCHMASSSYPFKFCTAL